jgi:autotransporter-associated beta strand protein
LTGGLVALLLAVGGGPVWGQDGLWSAGGGGSWANANNWDSGVIAGGTDSTATFGGGLYPLNGANLVFTLDAARTIGTLDVYGPAAAASWTLNAGAGGPLTLDSSFDTPAVYVTPATLQLTLNVVVAGTVGLEKLNPGTLVLAATNTYTGGTWASAGALLINGEITDPGSVIVTNATLGGSGTIFGPVFVQPGGILAPGGSPGTLTISNALTLQPKSTTVVAVNAATLAHDVVAGLTSVNYGGTLTVTNLAGAPAAGQSFRLFSAAAASGDFSGITPQLAGGLRWRFDPASGTLSVVPTNLRPAFASLAPPAASNLIFTVTNGVPGGTNYVLTATNLATPRANWTRLLTNRFDAGGNLVFTSAIPASLPRRFYQLSAQ